MNRMRKRYAECVRNDLLVFGSGNRVSVDVFCTERGLLRKSRLNRQCPSQVLGMVSCFRHFQIEASLRQQSENVK